MLLQKTTVAGISLLVGIALLLFSAAASAQDLIDPKLRQGYYLSLSGAASGGFHTTSDGTLGPGPGGGFRLRMGEAIARRFDVGIGGGVFWNRTADYLAVSGNFSLEGTVYPAENLWIQIGAGLGFTDFTRLKSEIDPVIGRFGGEYTLALGTNFYFNRSGDPWRSGGVAFSPFLGVHLGPSRPTGSWMLFAGVAITWWSGLSRNRLNLPLERAF